MDSSTKEEGKRRKRGDGNVVRESASCAGASLNFNPHNDQFIVVKNQGASDFLFRKHYSIPTGIPALDVTEYDDDNEGNKALLFIHNRFEKHQV